ncbi:MAG: hypothetical protein QOE70_3602 [Chthoniobacter sp.]|jgi:predicted acylesterase/phospholipase RssA/MinD-like ATPase involved in chromosome partitioning or flagellar assembly/tetratricopeptide (TPR) repeat protein|nr:hypothetical protein [Chthoniobacter sp.]
MIYTFYSFKGGVGRSMALANVAEYLYQRGLRVVMIDWDLEAPGLENFFYQDRQQIDTVCSGLGLIDLLLTYKRQFPQITVALTPPPSPVPPATGGGTPPHAAPTPEQRHAALGAIFDQQLPPMSAFLQPLRPSKTTDGQTASLSLLSAGWRAGDRLKGYADDVQAFDWAELYAAYEGETFFDWMRGQLLKSADIVLIDSRTGVTEMGGVCTRQLADVVVSFCTPNTKTLENVLRINESFNRSEVLQLRGQRAVKTVVVPTRIDASEKDRRIVFETRFAERSGTFRPAEFTRVKADFWNLRIPYIPAYTYQEALAIGTPDRDKDLEQSYVRLATHLALLAEETGVIRQRLSAEISKEFGTLLPRIFICYSRTDGRSAAEALRARLRAAQLTPWEEPSRADALSEQIRSQIAQSEWCVVLLTPSALESEWVQATCEFARAHGISIVPLRAAGVDQPMIEARGPRWLRQMQTLEAESEVEKLIRIVQQSPEPPLRVLFLAPPLPEPWVPREAELERLREALGTGSDAWTPRRVALCGLGGGGKSALAAAFCQQPDVQDFFEDGVLWADLASGAPAVLDEMARLFSALTGETAQFSNVDAAAEALAGKLSGKRCLLVLDHVPDAVHLQPFLRAASGCTLLLTARSLEVPAQLQAAVVEVGALRPEQSCALLAAFVPGGFRDPSALAELAAALCQWPLALRLAGAEMRKRCELTKDPARAAADVLAALAEWGITRFDRTEPADSLSSIAASLRLTLEQLVPRDRAQLDLWARSASAEGLIIYGREDEPVPPETSAQIQRFAALSLLRDWQPGPRRVRLHPLVHAYLLTLAPIVQPQPHGGAAERADQRVAEALRILRGAQETPENLLQLATDLRKQNEFGYARRLLARARQHPSIHDNAPLRRKLAQQHALCTYKDPDLILDERLDRALEILKQGDSLDESTDPETLGIAGAIHKRKWAVDAQRTHLETSLAYYLRGASQGIERDSGYTSINAAFLLDLLASQEEKAAAIGISVEGASAKRAEARAIRERVITVLSAQPEQPDAWWFYATVAEAAFGLGRYEDALAWLKKASRLQVADWEYQSTAQQLAALARLQEKEGGSLDSPAWSVIHRFLGSDTAVESQFVGKIGLALSGGGFRASLFHIGVLARLAELDVLRSVEVLSCVSGGSIIGAHYYLEVRNLLQTREDQEITGQDYIDIVKRIERDFLAGVQRNIRTRVAAEWKTNVRMIFESDYSQTHRAGELFEREIFARVADGEATADRFIDQLHIRPKGTPPDFKPKYDNWRRRAKVPVLILNATTLNTGHNWQFTASYMGEPPGAIDPEVDSNDRLRRMYYADAPERYRHFRLGHAVAASACVPGLFEPLALNHLYPEMTVRLVDGGVHDNQGIAGLLEQDATLLLVSDASGQMELQKEPDKSTLGVPLRANSILMARVREAEFHELRARRRASLLRGLMFVHLKKDLEVDPVDWIDCPIPSDASDDTRPAARHGLLTSYGIRKDVQEKISALRTDLDSFSDAEAFALMASGYRMTEREFAARITDFRRAVAPPQPWQFLAIEKFTSGTKGYEGGERELLRLLDVGRQLAFKIWMLSPPLQAAGLVLGGLALLILGFAAWYWSAVPLLTVGAVGAFVLGLAATAVVGKTVLRVVNFRAEFKRVVRGLAMSVAGFLAARLHLAFFDPLFLDFGKIERLQTRKPGGFGQKIGIFAIGALIAMALAGTAIFYSNQFQQWRILRAAPVKQTLATRGPRFESASAWAAALDLAKEKEQADANWSLIDAAIDDLKDPAERAKAIAVTASALVDAGRLEKAAAKMRGLITAGEEPNALQLWGPAGANPSEQALILHSCYKALVKLKWDADAEATRKLVLRAAEKAEPPQHVWVLAAIARDLGDTGHLEQAASVATEAEAFVNGEDTAVPAAVQIDELTQVAEAWAAAGNRENAVRVLEKAQQKAQGQADELAKRAVPGKNPPREQAQGQTDELANAHTESRWALGRVRDGWATIGLLDRISPSEAASIPWAAALARAGRFDDALKVSALLPAWDREKADLAIAREMARAGQADQARALCARVLAAARAIEDYERARSCLLAETAQILAALKDFHESRAIADECALPADRLDAYTSLLLALSSRTPAPRPDRATP